MNKTAQFELPLMLPAQAQKHVTVNEALIRLDAGAQLTMISDQLTPPISAVEGACYLVPREAASAWSGKEGYIAVWCNGGWIFLRPRIGWRGWDQSQAAARIFDGAEWLSDAIAISGSGAATKHRIIEFDHVVTPGSESWTQLVIPAQSQVVGVSGRVISPIHGSGVTAWSLGVADSIDRFGSGIGIDFGSYLIGLSGVPITYYVETSLRISAEGGLFSGGAIRLAIHLQQLVPPRLKYED